jgi:hypothetical protein
MSLIATVRGLLRQEEIPFFPDGPETVLLGFPDPDGVFYGDLQVDEAQRIILIQMAPPLQAPQEKIPQMLELVARANRHILQGGLQIGMTSGLITCKTSLILGNSRCQPDLFYNLLASNWRAITQWFQAIKAVIVGGLSPEQATDMIVRQQQADDGYGRNSRDVLHGRWDDIQHGSMN